MKNAQESDKDKQYKLESHGKRADTNKFTCLHTSKKNMIQQIYKSCSYLDIKVVMFESSSVYGF